MLRKKPAIVVIEKMSHAKYCLSSMSPREYYMDSGEPEDENVQKMFEQVAARERGKPLRVKDKYDEETFKKEWVDRIKKELEHLDFSLLESIAGKIAERCGIPEGQLNFVPKEKIVLKKRDANSEQDKFVQGNYRVLFNEIDIFPHSIVYSLWFSLVLPILRELEGLSSEPSAVTGEQLHEAVVTKLPLLSDAMVQFSVLRTLIHEQIHAMSFTRIISEHPRSFWQRLQRKVLGAGLVNLSSVFSGYSRHLLKDNAEGGHQENDGFLAFDEGVTDKLAFEILDEYLSAKDSTILDDQSTKVHRERLTETTYGACVRLVDELVRKIAQNAGMEERHVWQAIVRSKIEGVDLEDTEIARFIDESTFEGFFDRLKKLRPEDFQNKEDEEGLRTCLS